MPLSLPVDHPGISSQADVANPKGMRDERPRLLCSYSDERELAAIATSSIRDQRGFSSRYNAMSIGILMIDHFCPSVCPLLLSSVPTEVPE